MSALVPPVTILIVDDSPTIRGVLRVYLSKLKVEIVEAVDGMEALEKLRSQPIGLVFSDVQMPRMDGFGLLEAVRREFGGLPFVMITMEHDQDLRARALSGGVSALLNKPARAAELISLASSLLGLSPATPGTATPSG